MKNTLIAILLILVNLGFSQNLSNDELELKAESETWIKNLEKIDSKEKQINFIIEKIKQDSIIELKSSSDRIKLKVNDGITKQSKCKIVFVLSQKKSGHFLDLNKYPNFSVILKYLTNETISSIAILKDDKAISLYGSQAICGVIIMKSEDKKLRKLIKKSLRKQKSEA